MAQASPKTPVNFTGEIFGSLLVQVILLTKKGLFVGFVVRQVHIGSVAVGGGGGVASLDIVTCALSQVTIRPLNKKE
ncbi:MAG: hypothetical protein A2666_00620 [Parcubacteria group bacterium RIFCSPHIGHO2_01_FULL_47_10b]|nr:MAG: hypothetical protein A2666_00620 [Parcubacteria group bacterium RIFCSPHIGHO2_01_FULL_47_10b]